MANENNKGLAIAGMVCGIVGLLLFPFIIGVLAIIFGAVAMNGNDNSEPWTKAVWQYDNKALGFSRVALILGIIDVAWAFLNLL